MRNFHGFRQTLQENSVTVVWNRPRVSHSQSYIRFTRHLKLWMWWRCPYVTVTLTRRCVCLWFHSALLVMSAPINSATVISPRHRTWMDWISYLSRHYRKFSHFLYLCYIFLCASENAEQIFISFTRSSVRYHLSDFLRVVCSRILKLLNGLVFDYNPKPCWFIGQSV